MNAVAVLRRLDAGRAVAAALMVLFSLALPVHAQQAGGNARKALRAEVVLVGDQPAGSVLNTVADKLGGFKRPAGCYRFDVLVNAKDRASVQAVVGQLPAGLKVSGGGAGLRLAPAAFSATPKASTCARTSCTQNCQKGAGGEFCQSNCSYVCAGSAAVAGGTGADKALGQCGRLSAP